MSRFAPFPLSAVACAAALLSLPAGAQTRPPIAQFWMDVATNAMSIPGMGDMDEDSMGMMGGMFGGTKMMGGAPGRWLDLALHTRNKPAGTVGADAIPAGMAMNGPLPLLPVQAQPRGERSGEEPVDMERPKGRLLFYWGCGEAVRPGQPRVLDFARAGPEEWGKFMAGRFAPDRGAKAVPGRSVWPNEQDRQRIPKAASLEGVHAVSGDGVPAGLRFNVAEAYDFMPKVAMTAAGDAKGPVTVGWQPLNQARGYFLNAMGARGEQEMIFWSSSEQPDPGWGLLDYLSPDRVAKLIDEKVVLPPSVQRCVIPSGIFAGVEGAMVRMIAYGPELNVAHPPRPADPKAPWNPEWTARVRVKSTGMTLLGMEERESRPSRRRSSGREEAPPAREEEGGPGLGNPMNMLKGIFGR